MKLTAFVKTWISLLTVGFFGICGLYSYGLTFNTKVSKRQKSCQKTATRLLLTDFCLSTESRHTRHISMPELMAPFQDVPGFHEHFPSSSFFPPHLPEQKTFSGSLKKYQKNR